MKMDESDLKAFIYLFIWVHQCVFHFTGSFRAYQFGDSRDSASEVRHILRCAPGINTRPVSWRLINSWNGCCKVVDDPDNILPISMILKILSKE